jgi:hypothetical protein
VGDELVPSNQKKSEPIVPRNHTLQSLRLDSNSSLLNSEKTTFLPRAIQRIQQEIERIKIRKRKTRKRYLFIEVNSSGTNAVLHALGCQWDWALRLPILPCAWLFLVACEVVNSD